MPSRLATHRCKGCGAIIAMIDPRARRERFALCCAECGRHLVLFPERKDTPPSSQHDGGEMIRLDAAAQLVGDE
jgi:hypothetical protein